MYTTKVEVGVGWEVGVPVLAAAEAADGSGYLLP